MRFESQLEATQSMNEKNNNATATGDDGVEEGGAQLFRKPISATNKSVLDRSDCIVVDHLFVVVDFLFVFSAAATPLHMKSIFVIFIFYLGFFSFTHASKKLCIPSNRHNKLATKQTNKK